MHEYDVALQAFLRGLSAVTSGGRVSARLRWLNFETPKVRNLRVDLLVANSARRTCRDRISHRNEKADAHSMGESSSRRAGRMADCRARSFCNVGDAATDKDRIEGRICLINRFICVDILDLDGRKVTGQPEPVDHVIRLLTRLGSIRHGATPIGNVSRNGRSPERDRLCGSA